MPALTWRAVRGAQAWVAREEANQSAQEYHHSHHAPELPPETDAPSAETKALYKKIAVKIHPDKGTDERTKQIRGKSTAELNVAYERNVVPRMEHILNSVKAGNHRLLTTGKHSGQAISSSAGVS